MQGLDVVHCTLSLTFNQLSRGLDPSCSLRAIRYRIHLGSKISLFSGLVRTPFDPDIRDSRVGSHLREIRG